MKKVYLLIVMVSGFCLINADVSSQWDSFKSTMSGIGSGIKKFGTGMAESFGMAPPGYHYSFRVFNNTKASLYVNADKLMKFQNMEIDKKSSYKSITILPGGDSDNPDPAKYSKGSPSYFNQIGLYLEVQIEDAAKDTTLYSNKIINTVPAYKDPSGGEDPSVYCYHAYQNETGTQVEFLGANITTTDAFNGLISNRTTWPIEMVNFVYSGQKYSATLDPQSFNFLIGDNTVTNCVRPAGGGKFTFTYSPSGGTAQTATVAIASYGIASSSKDSKTNTTTTIPKQDHYEIYTDGKGTDGGSSGNLTAFQTGYNPGNYIQATESDLRNITPVQCIIWNQSAGQQKVDPGQAVVPYDDPNRSVWFGMSVKGWDGPGVKEYTLANGNKVKMMIGQVPLGKALQFSMIRPSIDASSDPLLKIEDNAGADIIAQVLSLSANLSSTSATGKSAPITKPTTAQVTQAQKLAGVKACSRLYIVSLDTTDEAKATSFMSDLVNQVIKFPDYTPPPASPMSPQEKAALLTTPLKANNALLEDPKSGVSGLLLASDLFLPYGSGSGPYYYTVYPPQVDLEIAYNMISGYIPDSKTQTTDQQNALLSKVYGWFKNAQNDSGSAKAALEDYLKVSGIDDIFTPNGTDTVDRTKLNTNGLFGVQKMVDGPGGLVNPPIYWSPGMNDTVYYSTGAPDGWKPSEVVNFPVVPSTPS